MVGGGPSKKEIVNPKAIIHQRFGDKARYNVEEVQDNPSNGCPGLAIPQKGPCLYRCNLELPEFSIMSDVFKRKKDAMQSAAEKALEKLTDPPVEDASDQLVARLSYLFSNEFYSTCHPLSGHFRAALQRAGSLNGFVPISVMPIFDSKLSNLCKNIKPETESKPLEVMSIVRDAAMRLSESILICKEFMSLKRTNPYPPEVLKSIEVHRDQVTYVKVLRIPYLVEKGVEPLTLDVSANIYYMDAIARELGAADASMVLLSRCIGKSSSETRLYSNAPNSYRWDKENSEDGSYLNARASYLSGQDVYGDAILATIGYLWKSCDLFLEDVSPRIYYRLLVNKVPTGIYKLSREAVLAAELPPKFGTRSNWRGLFPRDVLCTFCRQHRLPEPVFSLIVTKDAPEETSRCEVKMFSRGQNLILHYYPQESFKKQSDAIQNASSRILSLLNNYLKKLNTPQEDLTSYGNGLDLDFYPEHISKELSLSSLVHKNLLAIDDTKQSNSVDTVCSYNIEGMDSEVYASNGCLVCVCYSVFLVKDGEKEIVEKNDEFEFELGSEAVIPEFEVVVAQMGVGQSACFKAELPSQELIFAANGDPARVLSLLSSGGCSLEYSTTLLRVTEPLEDRMEKAFFSPSLSKQRVNYAVQHIKESGATFLVDFGCGSGSLLDSLLDYPTSLERIIGVDISIKALARAAKTLHSKLSNSTSPMQNGGLKSALLLDGSITTFDSRLYDCDIGTCLEVIEHMSEDQATLFGNVVLSSFCPKILIVSTPNYEYNVLLQKSTTQIQEEDEDKSSTKPCKFRNFDHKFEWTREQFQVWASDLAKTHNYSVGFSGVGGAEGVEPGFASQIAVFKRRFELLDGRDLAAVPYDVVWDWRSTDV